MVSHRGGNGFNADFKAVLTQYQGRILQYTSRGVLEVKAGLKALDLFFALVPALRKHGSHTTAAR